MIKKLQIESFTLKFKKLSFFPTHHKAERWLDHYILVLTDEKDIWWAVRLFQYCWQRHKKMQWHEIKLTQIQYHNRM